MSVQSIERAFSLLRAIAAHPDGISITELARCTQLHKSTVSRLVTSLETERAVIRAGGILHIGDGIVDLLANAIHPPALRTLLHRTLADLVAAINETAGLCIPDGDYAHYIDQVLTGHMIQVRDWTGERFPLHTVSSGKLFLAHRSDDEIDEYLRRWSAPGAAHPIADPALLRTRLHTIRHQGYDWSKEEFTAGLNVVSAPVLGRNGTVVASFYVCGPTFRFPAPDDERAITSQVVQAGREASRLVQMDMSPLRQERRLLGYRSATVSGVSQGSTVPGGVTIETHLL